MPRPGWNGARVTRAIAYVTHRDNGICHLCHHPGANSLDHLMPAHTHPELEWEPTNWKAAHLAAAGHTRGCHEPGCSCPGNTGRKDAPLELGPSRPW